MRELTTLCLLFLVAACGAGSSELRSGPGDEAGGGGSTTTQSCAVDLQYRAFISKWRVGGGDTVQLPLPTGFNYSFAIDWGDKSSESGGYPYISSFDDPDNNHTYSAAGEYTVTMYGLIEAWSFEALPVSKDKLVEVEELGDMGWKNLQGAFAGCSNLAAVKGGTTAGVTDMSSMFAEATSLQLDVSSWDFSKVSNMQSMLSGVTLPDNDYNLLLNRIVQTTTQNGVALDGGDSRYTAGAAESRNKLITAGWNIQDGGQR